MIMFPNEPTVHEPDSVLGWKNRTGNYEYPDYSGSGQSINMTFLSSGTRDTGGKKDSPNELIIVGGSCTQGKAISDEETYPWKLQNEFPTLEVLNYGTGAYGTYQSLLVLERILPILQSPVMILYGFVGHHETRNVATADWLALLSKYAKRGHVYLPFATIDNNGKIRRHPPEMYPAFPFRKSLASMALLEKYFAQIKTRKRRSQRRTVTEKLLLEMNELAMAHGTEFVVAMLLADEQIKTHYVNFLRENLIETIDCVYPLTPGRQVNGEGHPNGTMNSLWAECIARGIRYHLN
jgi:hypothetical protein